MTPEQMEIFQVCFKVDIEMQSVIGQLMHINDKVDEGVDLQEDHLRILTWYVDLLNVKKDRIAIDSLLCRAYTPLYNALQPYINTNLADQFRIALRRHRTDLSMSSVRPFLDQMDVLAKIDNLMMEYQLNYRWQMWSRSDPYAGTLCFGSNIVLTYPEYMKREPLTFPDLATAVDHWVKAMRAPVIYGAENKGE